MSLTIGVDLDGVLYDFEEAMRTYLVARRGFRRDLLPPVTQWDIWEDWGLSRDLFVDFMHAGITDGVVFHRGAPIDGGVAGVDHLRSRGHRVVIITARPQAGAMAATESWLAEHGIGFDEVRFATIKDSRDLDLLVDDSPDNVAVRDAAGLATLIFDQPWNAHLTGHPRARGWSGVVAAIDEYHR